MKPIENYIKVEKTARYFINKQDVNSLTSVWFVLHGYGYFAEDFINEFNFLEDGNTLLIAPEALSRFYTRKKIGASWMTREDRLNEINDYINYLEKIYNEINNKYDLSQSKNNLLGFSQGVHTAVRWFIGSKYKFNNLVLCSSDFPKDADYKRLNYKLEKSKLYFVYGSKDDIFPKSTYEESLALLKNNNVKFEEAIFEGGHRIDVDILKKLDILNKKPV